MVRGERYRLAIERPAAGGRMIARHEGAVVFVSGAIPGEVVEAEVEKTQRGTVWAATRDILEASPDRVPAVDGACGGSVFAHIAYERQRHLKAEIIGDAFRRLARLPLESATDVVGSPVDGYRMRARLHVRGGRIGFFREGTHALCDAAATRQLRADTIDVIRRLEASLAANARAAVSDIELAENMDASQRAIHLELSPDGDPSTLATAVQVEGLQGASCSHGDNPRTLELFGSTTISDTILESRIDRHVRAFFQGNRYLLQTFVQHVLAHVTQGMLVDLYAGVGLFSLTAERAAFAGPIIAVEGDTFAARDLKRNSRQEITVMEMPVEQYRPRGAERPATVIVDPPRTGMSKQALSVVLALKSPRVVYVSCDVATLARDARVIVDAGYRIDSLRAFDLFPNTAHVETVISFSC